MGGGRTVEKYNYGLDDCGMNHATAYTYGCRCNACKEYATLRNKKYRMKRLRNEVDPLVDAGPTRERLLRLRELGYSNRELERFGVYGVSRILHGGGKVRMSTERKVMEISGRKLVDRECVDSRAAAHLIKRWRDCGLTDKEIANLSGVHKQSIGDIRHGRYKTMQARNLGRLLKAKPAIDEMAMCKKGEL